MGYTMVDFSLMYDSISDKQVLDNRINYDLIQITKRLIN